MRYAERPARAVRAERYRVAGAWVDGGSYERATALGLDVRDYLARNDAYHFFAALGDLLRTGPTLTNVNDLMFVYAF